MTRGRRGRLAPAALTVSILSLLLIGLAGCGSASEPSPPTGVDQLVIPTPSITPSDFVATVDNRWLPLTSGASWTYDVTGESVAGGAATMTVTVLPGRTTVDGVRATTVRTRTSGGSGTQEHVDYYAQDRLGNVWRLGRAGVWQAGEDGAQAGLAMPAQPRYGDGWREAYQAGVVADRAEVTALDDAFTLGGRRFDDVLDLTVSSDLSPGISEVQSYVSGVGLVRSYAADGPADLVELVSGP